MSPRLKKVAFFCLFSIAFVAGLLLTLPNKMLARVAETQIEKAMGFQYDVEIESIRLSGPSSLRLRGVTFTSTAEVPIGERPIPAMTIDRIRVRANLLSLVRGRPKARVQMDIGEGQIVVRTGRGSGMGSRIKIEVFDLDLRLITIIRSKFSLPLQGIMQAVIEIGVEDGVPIDELMARAAVGDLDVGRLEIGISGMAIGPGNLRGSFLRDVGGALPLPVANCGDLVARATLADGAFVIDQWESVGDDLQTEVYEGRIDLNAPFSSSRLRLTFLIQPSSDFIERAELGPALARVPLLARAQTQDGYALAMGGVISNLGEPQPLTGRRGD